MPIALPSKPKFHSYSIRLEHGYERETENIELEAIDLRVALCVLDTIPHKRHAIIFEDGLKVADLTFLEGF